MKKIFVITLITSPFLLGGCVCLQSPFKPDHSQAMQVSTPPAVYAPPPPIQTSAAAASFSIDNRPVVPAHTHGEPVYIRRNAPAPVPVSQMPEATWMPPSHITTGIPKPPESVSPLPQPYMSGATAPWAPPPVR